MSGRNEVVRTARRIPLDLNGPAWKSIQVALWLAGGGVLLTGSNLLLAGLLDPIQFGWFSLFQSFLALGVGLVPLGIDSLIARHEMQLLPRTLVRVIPALLLAGSIVAAISVVFYAMSWTMAIYLVAGTSLGAVGVLSAARERGALRLNTAQLIVQLPFLILLIGTLFIVRLHGTEWQTAGKVQVVGCGVAAMLGVILLKRASVQADPVSSSTNSVVWSRAMSFLGINGSVLLLLYLERLLIPHLLGLADLATFSLLAITVGSPYRLLQAGTSYALLPRLRSAPDPAKRAQILKHELWLVGILSLAGGVILLAGVGPLIRYLYHGKYVADFALIVIVILAGIAKAGYGIAEGVIEGCGNAQTLSRYNWGGWVVTGAAAALAVGMAPFGLSGIVAATGAGWVGRAVIAYWLIRLQDRTGGTVEALEHGPEVGPGPPETIARTRQ